MIKTFRSSSITKSTRIISKKLRGDGNLDVAADKALSRLSNTTKPIKKKTLDNYVIIKYMQSLRAL